ncbi:MAG TPA: SEC-C metal-binding domain-containing protein [Acidimicrobiales bacterium]|nr:SEC-C metal-binding domain-containing protein [Acidimicrobiales bacterium]
MAEISFNESYGQIRAINVRVQEAEKAKDWGAAIAGLHELLDQPCAHHQVAAYEVWDNIHELHKSAGDYDAAIAAKQEAVRAGYRSEPHPDADIAECHLLAGRRAEADALFADLRARTPDDVWLYNSAGFSYAAVPDHRESARWFRDGIDVALRTGDPDQVVVQLLEGLEAAWKALGESPESGLNDRVEAFVEAWQPPPGRVRHHWGGDPPPLQQRRCAHCGFDSAILKASVGPQDTTRFDALPEFPSRQTSRLPSSMVVSLAWFPRGEWDKATATWPDLLEELPADHTAYSHRIEARMKRLARTLAGHPMRVAPMTVEDLTEFSAEEGESPGTGEARSSYAAEIARRDDAVAWPPGRNAPCWCGSDHKYKTCCGPIPSAPE